MVISDKTTTSSLLDPALFAQIYFRNKDEEDPDKVAQLKTDAIRGLTNYLVYQASEKDDRLKTNIDTKDEGSSGENL